MSNIYGGDEVNAIVVDIGTHLCRAGYAGDDTPKSIFPSSAGVVTAEANGMEVDGQAAASTSNRKLHVGHSALMFRRDHMQIQSPFDQNDLLSDFDIVEAMLEHSCKDRLCINTGEYAVMMAEPSHNTKESREKMVQLLFDKFNVPAVFLSKSAVLSSFATAKQTSLVVDMGHRSTTIAAVHEGYLLTKSVVRSPLGGQLLTRALKSQLEARGAVFKPRFAFKRTEKATGEFQVQDLDLPLTTPSFRQYHEDLLAADVKESLCRVSDTHFNEEENSNIPTVSYELPDGTELQVGAERFKVPEVLFRPQLLSSWPGLADPPVKAWDGSATRGLQEAIMACINLCDVDVRKDLFSSVVMTGGASQFLGLRDRLERELQEVGPQAARIKVFTPPNPLERRFSVWLGGSILASLGSFQQMWMSKREYEEHGASLIHRKAP